MAFRKVRTRIYLGVEGEGEQSFIKFLQMLADQNGLYAHLDCQVLGGGGYQSMLKRALHYRTRKSKAKFSVLLVDGDRDQRNDDGWTLDQLRREAIRETLQICVQNPNQEGLLLRMLPGNENLQPNVTMAHKQLFKQWPRYEKPIDARMLSLKFKLDDVLRVARVDSDLNNLLSIVGLLSYK